MKSVTTFLICVICIICGSSLSAADRPNIMIFLVDDMGVMDTSVPFLTGEDGKPKRYPLNDWYRTPNMERLAARGMRFNNFHAMSVCSPTRVCIMTGQNSTRHRVTNWINPDKDNAGPQGPPGWRWKGLAKGDVTLPGVLRENGYRTIHVGKAHFGARDSEGAEPLNLGFDVNIGGASFGAPGSYYGEKNYGHGTKRAGSGVPHLEKYHGTGTFLTEALTIEAKKAVADTVKSGKPFYLYFAHYAVHAPFESDPRFADHYKDSAKPENAQAFATLIEGMDKSLGDMLDQFDELGIAESTLVIFLGDNGSDAPLGPQHDVACAAPLRGKKGAHYEGGTRVPFIAAWPRRDDTNPFQGKLPIARGGVQRQLTAVYDIFPTILNLLDIDKPAGHAVDGADLATLLTGALDPLRRETFLMHYPHAPHRSNYFTDYLEDGWKLIYHYLPEVPVTGGGIQSGGERYELFDLESDPFEQTNLASSNPEKLTRMVGAMIKALEAEGALFPVDDDGKPLKPRLP